jgi:sortase B
VKKPEKKKRSNKYKFLFIVAFTVFFAFAAFSATQIILGLREYAVAENEYVKLREVYEPPEESEQAVDNLAEDELLVNLPDTVGDQPNPPEVGEEEPPPKPQPVAPSPSPRNPSEVNAEYIGWLKIDGTDINYPMAKAEDNEKYLKTSFEGYKNALGAIFMDYRCAGDFSSPHSIIYGHNAKNGSMFGSLAKYLDAAYLEKNREITITLPDGEKKTWRIFAARKSDITDFAYRLSFSSPESFATFSKSLEAPEGASQIITLSTCTSGGSKDERMLVHAVSIE